MTGGLRPFTIVTGASRGIGRAVALALADAGHDLALVAASRRDALDQVVKAAGAKGSNASGHIADVSDERAVDALFGALGERSARLSGLINNAGITGDRVELAELPVAEWDRVLAVNVRGTMLMARKAIPAMRAQGGGAIVNLSSQSATFGGAGLTAYAAAKGAVNSFTMALAREVAGAGIRVNALSPGPVLTEPLQALGPERLAEMEKTLPLGRFCTEEEVAAVAVWLLSDQASYVSGAIVPVHGAR